jgi:hypothetical protein
MNKKTTTNKDGSIVEYDDADWKKLKQEKE